MRTTSAILYCKECDAETEVTVTVVRQYGRVQSELDDIQYGCDHMREVSDGDLHDEAFERAMGI